MPATFVSCPYCNASMPAPDPIPEVRRMSCDRCGESFPLRELSEPASDAPNGPSIAIAPAGVKRRNRRIGLFVLLGMAAMFTAALIFALVTRERRTRTLDESPALRYLPDDTNVIIAVNVVAADAARTERSKEKDMPAAPDLVDQLFFSRGGLINVENMTGLKRADLDEFMIGMKLDERSLIPQVRFVVRTRSAYNAEILRERLGAHRSKQEGAKKLDLIRPRGLPLGDPVLWCASSETFVITLSPDDMSKVPDEPAKNVDRLPAPLVDLMRYRVEKGTFLWLMGHADNWEQIQLASLLTVKLTPQEKKKLLKMQTFAVAARQDAGAVTSRARPARVTEQVEPAPPALAVDFIFAAAGENEAVELRELVEAWLKKQNLEVRDTSLKGPLYTATLAGQPDDWEKALNSLRAGWQFR